MDNLIFSLNSTMPLFLVMAVEVLLETEEDADPRLSRRPRRSSTLT